MSGVNVIVISDTHGDIYGVQNVLDKHKTVVSHVIHLGDHSKDMARYMLEGNYDYTYHIVNGNTDLYSDIYEDRLIEINSKKIFITHGHMYNVKLDLQRLTYKAMEMGADACFFGHTHSQVLFKEEGIFFLNPGSPTHPRTANDKGYALVRISDEGNIVGKFIKS